MIGRAKSPSVAELTEWLAVETNACRFNFADSNASGQAERAAFWTRRLGYLEATVEVIGWFREDTPTS